MRETKILSGKNTARSFLLRVENSLRTVFRAPPSFSDFAGGPSDQLKSDYQGRAAKIFFASKHRVVHKWLHYLPIYDQLLGPYVGTEVKMLEIGVSKGGSLALWREFLGKKALIFGIDVNPECAAYNGENGNVRIGSQDDLQFLESVVREMNGLDIVLDDGSHVASHQRASFNALFPMLSEGGLYIIEDVQTAYWPHFEGGLKRRGTAIEFLKSKIDDMHAHYRKKGINNIGSMQSIESIQFFDSIVAIRKRRQRPRYHVMLP